MKIGPQVTIPPPDVSNQVTQPAVSNGDVMGLEELMKLPGYDANFLGPEFPLSLGNLLSSQIPTSAPLSNQTGLGVLNYDHYSVVVNAQRRMPMVVAENVGGKKQWFALKRPDQQFRNDPRMDKQFQLDNSYFVKNDLDVGHLANSADAQCGDDKVSAEAAMRRTFFFPNTAPQHKDLNRITWKGLEAYVRKACEKGGIRATVFEGPVFSPDDPWVENGKGGKMQVPIEFWKLVVTNVNGKPSAAAYLLSQKSLLVRRAARLASPRVTPRIDDIVFKDYKTYNIPISLLAEKTGLNFGPLRQIEWQRPVPVSRLTTGFQSPSSPAVSEVQFKRGPKPKIHKSLSALFKG